LLVVLVVILLAEVVQTALQAVLLAVVAVHLAPMELMAIIVEEMGQHNPLAELADLEDFLIITPQLLLEMVVDCREGMAVLLV
jgi:hypothetical protein